MAHDRPRWRFRISTLMLLVIILALSLALVSERWERVEHEDEEGLTEVTRKGGRGGPKGRSCWPEGPSWLEARALQVAKSLSESERREPRPPARIPGPSDREGRSIDRCALSNHLGLAMAHVWVNGHVYYTKSVRQGGRVTSTSYGPALGEYARLFAAADRLIREKRRNERMRCWELQRPASSHNRLSDSLADVRRSLGVSLCCSCRRSRERVRRLIAGCFAATEDRTASAVS